MRFFYCICLCFFVSFGFAQETKTLFLPDSVAIMFKAVPAGEFIMGSLAGELHRDNDEAPRTKVYVPSFWMGIHEVTQKQWLAVMRYNPSVFTHKADHLEYPVESVTWLECEAFIEKLNQLGMGTFRLPSEEEWEYACRAGTDTAYYWGDYENERKITTKAWINSRSMATTNPVGKKPANPWGLYDMSGNVWEWTSTSYAKYGQEAKTDSLKVFRGGSWFDFGNSQRSANRHKHKINEKYTSIGLRLVWTND